MSGGRHVSGSKMDSVEASDVGDSTLINGHGEADVCLLRTHDSRVG